MGWSEDLNRGAKGEAIVKDYLISLGSDVIDVSKIKKYQDIDVDIIVNKTFLCEIKSDDKINATGNIYCEMVSNLRIKSPGYMIKCQAEKLLYYDTVGNILYEIDFKAMKQYVEDNKRNLKEVKGGDNSLGLLLPLHLITEITKIHQLGG
jgi:hypothetical protein